MKARLLWLFVLVCAFLLALGLMVVAEGPMEADLPSYRQTYAVPGPVMWLPAEAKAEQAMPSRALPQEAGECPPQPRTHDQRVEMPVLLPYRLIAYHAFHLSDEAG